MTKILLDLGNVPLVNNLCSTELESVNAEAFPLRALIDDDLLVKLDVEIPSEKMFSTYLYRSGVNEPYARHCREMWQALRHLNPGRIIDVGGNDGTLLTAFQSVAAQPLELVNVDASQSFAEENERRGIRYVNAYWGTVDVEPADLIVSTNVFQHNPDVATFLRGVKKGLRPRGLWVLEFPYLLRTAETLQFDQFYHEHVYYWLLTPLVKLLAEHGLAVTGVSEHAVHGGTLRVQVRHAGQQSIPADLSRYLAHEAAFDFAGWAARVNEKIAADARWLDTLDGEVVGYGAAAKGCVYLNTTRCFTRLTCVVDDTPEKRGKFIPGTPLKIVSQDYLHAARPPHVLILAHNFADYIAGKLRPWYRGDIITMLPRVRIDRLAA